MFLSVVIPAYNEEKRIKKTLLQINDYLSLQRYDYEIIVVNDGSNDATSEVARKLEIPNLTIVSNEKNYGKGYVVKQGLLRAKGVYRLFMDADNSTSIKELSNFLLYAKNYDIIIGSRNMQGSKIINSQPLYRRILGIFYGLLARLATGLFDIKDIQCGFKLLNAKAVKDILPSCNINGFAFDSEVLVIAKKMGHTIKEVPVVWANDAQTKVRFLGMLKMFLDLSRIRWNLVTGKYKS